MPHEVPIDEPPAPALLFERVGVTSDDGSTLLHAVDAAVFPGAITAVVGPSGAGKSTLMRLGDRLEVPSAGRVLFEGADVAGLDPCHLRRSVGMVFQRPVLFAGTVAENLRVADAGASEARMTAELRRVGLGPELLTRVGDDLSGGEAQRVCIARTLLTEPVVVLMDEPTSALDPESRHGIEELARSLAADGIGILGVTHDHAQMRRLADHSVVLREGRRLDEFEAQAYLDEADRRDPS